MKILGFNFTKISTEKKKDNFKGLNIKNEVDITDVKEISQEIFKSKDQVLTAKFKYSITYSPDIASLDMTGVILFSTDSEEAKEILKQWKDKKMPEEIRFTLINVIFRKAGLKAMEMEDTMNLPLHINMPSLRKKEANE